MQLSKEIIDTMKCLSNVSLRTELLGANEERQDWLAG